MLRFSSGVPMEICSLRFVAVTRMMPIYRAYFFSIFIKMITNGWLRIVYGLVNILRKRKSACMMVGRDDFHYVIGIFNLLHSRLSLTSQFSERNRQNQNCAWLTPIVYYITFSAAWLAFSSVSKKRLIIYMMYLLFADVHP